MHTSPGAARGALIRNAGTYLVAAVLFAAGFSGRQAEPESVLIFLPGSQPGTVDTVSAGGAAACSACHATQPGSREVHIFGDWSGSMMAQSARDPVFYAALAVANKYSVVAGTNTGEYCIRCHSPTGWLAARSEDITARALRGTDLDGVQCEYCHRLADPLNPDSTILPGVFPVPGYGNGMHLVQTSSSPLRGPRDSVIQVHPAIADPFQDKGELCGVCHDVSNPYQTAGSERIDLPPHMYSPLERTYSEWLMSDYPSMGPAGSCQGCHMSPAPGYSTTLLSAPLREDIHAHDLTGGNSFVPRILSRFWSGLDTAALHRGAVRAEETLRRAAALTLTAERSGGAVSATVRVTNLTGHKLPTGYPEGRLMWLTVCATDSVGDTVFISGAYDDLTATLAPDSFLRRYEAVHGLTSSTAAVYGLETGASHHFSVNDTILSDNRIPPKGFTNAGFQSRLAGPVGASYADGVFWDDAQYPLPSPAVFVRASLWYQSVSREYAEFLRDENLGNVFDWNSWGEKLFNAWDSGGRSAPVLMDSVSATVPPGDPTAVDPQPALPVKLRLHPAWPNPFNSTVSIRFTSGGTDVVSLEIFDLAGRRVTRLFHGLPHPGDRTLRFDAGALAGGIYIARLSSAGFSQEQKILLIR